MVAKALRPSILDLYSGCGGFSLGAHQAGFDTKLAVDLDPLLSSSFSVNFPKAKLLNADVRGFDKATMSALIPDGVDGVVGGPPCQAFSEMGRRYSHDPRRRLVKEFFRVVALVRPKFFVFENVRGLGFSQNSHLIREGLALLPRGWQIVGPTLLNAADYGAPTRRIRLFVFGFCTDEMDAPEESVLLRASNKRRTVRDAISDLIGARSVGYNENGYDLWSYDGRRKASSYAKEMRASGNFTSHKMTVHTRDTLKRFARLAPGDQDKIGKYTRLSWEGLCPTLRAGTGNDRGSYQAVRPIHPLEDRVITAREAARLQGFPDNFVFHPTVWHSCRMIGNSVSPILAKKLMHRIAQHL